MISRKELDYVRLWAKNAPFPGTNYAANVIDQLRDAYEMFEQVYKGKEYSLIFSNGEEINFEILGKNIAHLLGIDSKGLQSDIMSRTVENVLGLSSTQNKGSLELLKAILERGDEVIKNDANPGSFKILNYYKNSIKCEIFSKFSDFSKFNFGCVNFDSNILAQQDPEPVTFQSSKLLFTPSDELIIPYFLMGIKYDEQSNKYIPETLLADTNCCRFFNGQELVLPTQILVSSENELLKLAASSEEKLALLRLYKNIQVPNGFNPYINIYNDYEAMLTADKEGRQRVRK